MEIPMNTPFVKKSWGGVSSMLWFMAFGGNPGKKREVT